MKILCLFDLDGTLTDPKIGITKSVAYALNSFGIQVSDLDELTKFIGPPLRDSFRKYYDFSDIEAEEAVAKYREYFSDKGIFENSLYDGIIEMLARLKVEGITMAIATSKPTVYAEKIAEHFGFREYFEAVIGSELDGTRSRKSEVISYALDAVDPDRKMSAVMIGDREHDIIGGRETGIDTIGVTWGYGSHIELEQAGATRIVDSPDGLLHHLTNLIVKKATPADAESLHNLYHNHLTANPPTEPQDMAVWRENIARFQKDLLYHLLVGKLDGIIVSSVTLIIIENLTHNTRPYAVIENVVTHADYRGRHYATELMSRAREIASEHDCYKIMLLTGSKKDSTLHFYENCGFNQNDKTAFIKRL